MHSTSAHAPRCRDAHCDRDARDSLGPQEMARSRFSVTDKDESLLEIMRTTPHAALATWAADCAERVLPYFEQAHAADHRPRDAIRACREWVRTGVFEMAATRAASLGSHAAAREVGQDSAARSAARAAGQAVAIAHVPSHSIGAANYALQAIYRASDPHAVQAAIAKEREWQVQRLVEPQGAAEAMV
jgi:hypothetical protein